VSARARAGLITAIERRLGASLGLGREFRGDDSWDEIRQQLVAATEKAHRSRAERSLAEIERELKSLPAAPTRGQLTLALINMAWGTATAFDQKTHRKVAFRTQRLNYFHVAADMLADWEAAELKEDVVAHLRGAVDALRRVWGEAEFRRLAGVRPADLPPELIRHVDEAALAAAASLSELPAEAQAALQAALGRQALTHIFRQLMLHVIGSLWVDYLTSVEALRTSIGLEAYAQRDPLVAYKSKAFEMFQELLVNMRAGVVARAFTLRVGPRPQAEPAASPRTGAPARAAATPGNGGSAAPAGARNLARNDPCWCGSGKKYKDCHRDADRASQEGPAVVAEAAAQGSGEGGRKRRRRRR
jgi:preprotein translocase subunit SecA